MIAFGFWCVECIFVMLWWSRYRFGVSCGDWVWGVSSLVVLKI